MKKLILVRHANALSTWEAKVESDRLRPLSPAGQEKAQHTAQALAKQGIHPEIIFTSPLVRATQTAAFLSKTLEAPVQPENILNGFASDSEVCEFLTAQFDTYHTVLAVGHNPNITYVGHLLFREVLPFAPGAFAIINMDDDLNPQLMFFGE